MRIRIQTYTPLPDVKAWFVPDAHNVPENISNLKDELCRRVQALKDAQYHGPNLTLLLDDFELLDDSPFSAVRDGDLICIKQLSKSEVAEKSVVPAEQPRGHKRKRSHIPPEQIPIPAQKPTQSKPATPQVVKRHKTEYDSDSSTSSSSSSSSASSASSASSTSTSSTSSSATSSSTPSSEESSAPKPLSSKVTTPAPTTTKPTSQTVHVPPGLGKPATHSRNNRRRKKREFLKDGASATPTTTLKGASEANSLPLGPAKPRASASTSESASVPLPASPVKIPISFAVKSSSSFKNARTSEASIEGSNDSTPAPVYVTNDQVMMSSMRNKNKKKGFKLSMSNPIPQKIVFDGTTYSLASPEPDQMQIDAQPQPQPSTSTSTSASSSSQSLFNSTGPSPHARLVPPSEIQERGELPPNMFVTSVDVEAGMWGDYSNGTENGNSKAKRKGKKKVRYTDEEMYADGDESYYADEQANEGPAVLDYSEGGGGGTANDGAGSGEPEFDWDRAEKLMTSAPLVTSPEQLKPGVLLGWMELGIDPRTFCPEDMVHVARVVEGPDLASGKDEVTLCKIRRVVGGDTAFSFLLDSAPGEGEEDEETVSWLHVLGSERYRVLNM